MGFRTETDSFGPLDVPAEKYWGCQTQRSLQNFRIGAGRDTMPPGVVRAFGVVKRAVARVNMAGGVLPADIGKAVVEAAEEVLHDSDFPPLGSTALGSALILNILTRDRRVCVPCVAGGGGKADGALPAGSVADWLGHAE
jgi:hypothetical protein